MEKAKIGGIMQSDGRAMIKILSVPDHVGVAAGVLGAMGRNHINIELLVQSFDLDDDGNFSMVIDQKDLDLALTVLDRIRNDIDARAVSYAPDVAVITVFAPAPSGKTFCARYHVRHPGRGRDSFHGHLYFHLQHFVCCGGPVYGHGGGFALEKAFDHPFTGEAAAEGLLTRASPAVVSCQLSVVGIGDSVKSRRDRMTFKRFLSRIENRSLPTGFY